MVRKRLFLAYSARFGSRKHSRYKVHGYLDVFDD